MAPLLVGVVGLDVWRATFAALARGDTPRGVARIGMAVGLAFAFGQSMSLGEVFMPSLGDERTVLPGESVVLFQVFWGILLGAVLAVFFRWIAAGASTWLELAIGNRSPRPALVLCMAVASALLAVWLDVLFEAYVIFRWTGAMATSPTFWQQFERSSAALDDPAALAAVGGLFDSIRPLILGASLIPTLTLLTVWALPLAPWFSRMRSAANPGAGWAYLEQSPGLFRRPSLSPLRLGLAVEVGLVGGVGLLIVTLVAALAVYGVLLSPIRFLLRDWLTATATGGTTQVDRLTDMMRTGLLLAPILVFVVLVTVAAVVMRRVPRLSVIHALCATTVGAAVVVAATFGFLAWQDTLLDLTTATTVVALVSLAVAAACVAGGGASAIVGGVLAVYRRTTRPGDRAPRVSG
jgi:hypothetical protein